MTRLPLRTRFAGLAAVLVVLVASLIGLAAYLSFRHSTLSRAAHTARVEANRLAGLVDVGKNAGGQNVDLTDSSLTGQLATPGLLVVVRSANGQLVRASAGARSAAMLAATSWQRCLADGGLETRASSPPLAVACARVGGARRPVGSIAVGVPLQSSLASLATLRRTLILGIAVGAVLAAVLSLLLARRALRPLGRIATAAETIRSGDLSQRIGYRGHDELGEVARVLDGSFAELEEAVQRQRRFAADASHELRTPLAAIRANVELLRGWAGLDESRREAVLEALDASSHRASRLVADLLHLVHSEREPSRPRSRVRLDEVVLSAVREAAPLRNDVSIRVVRLDDVTVSGDPLGLQQVLLNVLDNALQASMSGTEVTVGLAVSGDHAAVTVTDHGPGIAPNELERIFDRLYSRKRSNGSHQGAGLGLSIARSIAREHGGDLIARNERGAGATFVLTLPLSAALAGAQNSATDRDHDDAGSRTTKTAPASLG